MDHLSQNQVIDTFLVSGLSLFCVGLFTFMKSNNSCLREVYLRYWMAVWSLLTLASLVIFSVKHGTDAPLPDDLAWSAYAILSTACMWAVAMFQVVAVIYPFAVAVGRERWLRWIQLLELAEVGSIIISAMTPGMHAPMELACIAPFTSQTAAVGIILFASRGLPSSGVPKHTADHLSLLGIISALLSTLLLGLSLGGYYGRLILPQWLLHMTFSTVAYRLPDRADQGPCLKNGGSETALFHSCQQAI